MRGVARVVQLQDDLVAVVDEKPIHRRARPGTVGVERGLDPAVLTVLRKAAGRETSTRKQGVGSKWEKRGQAHILTKMGEFGRIAGMRRTARVAPIRICALRLRPRGQPRKESA